MSNEIIENLFKDWLVLNEKIFSEKFTYNNQEFYLYYQLSGVINLNLIGGTVSFQPLALIVKEITQETDEYYLFSFDESCNLEEIIEHFVLEIIL